MDLPLKIFLRRFVDFTDEELEQVWSFFNTKKIKKGEFMCVPNEVAHEIGFVTKGVFRIFYLVEGKENTRFIGCENIFITSTPSFTTQTPSIEYVEALENSTLLTLTYQDLQKMFEISPKWERLVRLLVEFSYNEQQERIYSLIALTALERYEMLAKNRPDFIQRVPQYIIANYLGISPETLSRIRKQ
jgi:CRP/FNR family transcriptional regulator, anaerobic regulatory protein